jgi:hypothetical protein
MSPKNKEAKDELQNAPNAKTRDFCPDTHKKKKCGVCEVEGAGLCIYTLGSAAICETRNAKRVGSKLPFLKSIFGYRYKGRLYRTLS